MRHPHQAWYQSDRAPESQASAGQQLEAFMAFGEAERKQGLRRFSLSDHEGTCKEFRWNHMKVRASAASSSLQRKLAQKKGIKANLVSL